MFVHPEGASSTLPDLDEDIMPVFDAWVALARSDEAVEHEADFGVEGQLEPCHLDFLRAEPTRDTPFLVWHKLHLPDMSTPP